MDPVKVRPFRPYRTEGGPPAQAVNSRRARVVLLSRGGVPNREIATRVGNSPQ